jgi:hypothetical protein
MFVVAGTAIVRNHHFKETNMLKATTVIVGVLFALSSTTAALAAAPWEKSHPRRDQVNDRLATQNRRIHQQLREGDLTKAQAVSLHRQDRKIVGEERLMASQRGGHISKLEQVALNQQENRISARIGE